MTEPKAAFDVDELESRIGTVLKGKWTLERLIGVGGMAAVYEARHEIGRRDAIKIMHPAYAGDAQLVERFRREAHAVNRFAHPGVAEVRDVDVTSEGLPFLVMELLSGESVGDKLRKGPIEIEQALSWGDQMLDVLATAHARGVVHRDVKPSNLFIEGSATELGGLEGGHLRLLDFGVAKLRETSGKPITEVGTTLGTVAYMPPEQLEKSDVDPRADVFAAAATLFEMLAHRRIHEIADVEQLARTMISTPAPALASVAPRVPERVCRVIDRALAFRAARRYPSAATMRADLQAAIGLADPPLASRLIELGDDPRSKKAPTREVIHAIEELAVATPGARAVTPTVSERPERDDEATTVERPAANRDDERETVKREVVDDDATTAMRGVDGHKTEVGDAPVAGSALGSAVPPSPSVEPAEHRSAPRWLWLVAALALGVVVVVWRTRDRQGEPPPPIPVRTSADAPARPTMLTPQGESGAASTLDVPEPAAPEPGGTPAPGSSAAPRPPRPGSSSGQPHPPSGLPTAFPSGFPTTLPSGFPTAFPTVLPSAFPTRPKPAPSTPPPPPPP